MCAPSNLHSTTNGRGSISTFSSSSPSPTAGAARLAPHLFRCCCPPPPALFPAAAAFLPCPGVPFTSFLRCMRLKAHATLLVGMASWGLTAVPGVIHCSQGRHEGSSVVEHWISI